MNDQNKTDDGIRNDITKLIFSTGLKFTLSGPRTNDETAPHKIVITDKGAYDQVEYFVGTKVFHENIARAELPQKLAELMQDFRHLTGSDDQWVYDYRVSKKGKLLGGRKRNQAKEGRANQGRANQGRATHNHTKHYIL